MAVLDEGARAIAVVTVPCPHRHFPSVGALHPPAIRLERAVRDLYGLEPVGLPDTRPWLDLGFWDVQHPLGERGDAPAGRAPYPFLPTAGEGLHQIPDGPVHAGIIEPGHFRFTANGETVVRLEQRLGYVHKGIEALMAPPSTRPHAWPAEPRVTARSLTPLPLRMRSRRRRTSRFRRVRSICGRSWQSSNVSPIISEISGPSAMMRRSRSCTPSAASCARTPCAPRSRASAIG